jgi:hypothetical protein
MMTGDLRFLAASRTALMVEDDVQLKAGSAIWSQCYESVRAWSGILNEKRIVLEKKNCRSTEKSQAIAYGAVALCKNMPAILVNKVVDYIEKNNEKKE